MLGAFNSTLSIIKRAEEVSLLQGGGGVVVVQCNLWAVCDN